jgi:outer membrane protein assembly factor BamD (BamD/ComL family)
MGREYLKKLVELYPNGEYAKQAQDELSRLPAAPKQ